MSLVEEILKDYEHLVESLSLIPSDGGRFEVSVNGQTIYSKMETKRHAEAGEIVSIISKMVD